MLLNDEQSVLEKENYSEHIGSNASAKNKNPRRVWFGGSVAQHIEEAAKRYPKAKRADRRKMVSTGYKE